MKSERTDKNREVNLLRIKFDKEGSLEPNREKLENLLSRTTKALMKCLWSMRKLPELLVCRNWYLLLSRSEMSVHGNCYELPGSGK